MRNFAFKWPLHSEEGENPNWPSLLVFINIFRSKPLLPQLARSHRNNETSDLLLSSEKSTASLFCRTRKSSAYHTATQNLLSLLQRRFVTHNSSFENATKIVTQKIEPKYTFTLEFSSLVIVLGFRNFHKHTRSRRES